MDKNLIRKHAVQHFTHTQAHDPGLKAAYLLFCLEKTQDPAADVCQLQPVDERIENWRNEKKFDGHEIVQVLRQLRRTESHVQQIQQHGRGVSEQAGHVRRARVPELFPHLCGRNAQFDQIHVRPTNKQKVQEIQPDVERHDDAVGSGRGASEVDHHQVDAVEPVDVRAAQLSPQEGCRVHKHTKQRHEPGQKHKERHSLPRHERSISQRPAQSHVPVVSHQCQDGKIISI